MKVNQLHHWLTDFSYSLDVDGVNYTRMGDMQYSFSANGYGLSGICTKTFSVSLPAADFTGAGENAEVKLSCSDASKLFPIMYISSRDISTAGKVKLNCFDRMAFTAQTISLTAMSYDDNNEILISLVLSQIADQCGFASWSATNTDAFTAINKLTKDQTYQKSCDDILSMIATACGGFFFTDSSTGADVLIFKAFGTSAYMGVAAEKHTKVVTGNTKGPLTQLIMTNNDTTYVGGSNTTSMYKTIKISTSLASGALATAVENVFHNYEYTSWNCEKALISSVPTFDTSIVFGDGVTRIANYGTLCPRKTGLYFSGGRNTVTEDEFDYTGKLERDINNRITWGERFGNLMIGKDGKQTFYQDLN